MAAAIIISIPARAEPIAVTAKPVALDSSDASRDRTGNLTYLGGLRLRSDAKGFGGFSGLDISADGAEMIAVSDFGRRLDARLTYAKDGRLAGISNARLAPLTGLDGKPITGKGEGDAEDIARLGDELLVSFERHHRILAYGADVAIVRAVGPPPGLEKAPANGGIEALTALPGGRLLAILEAATAVSGGASSGASPAWIRRGQSWTKMHYARTGKLSPSGAATVPAGKGEGDVLVIERHWSLLVGTRVRIAHLGANDLAKAGPGTMLRAREIARLEAPLIVDNFEGIAIRRGPGGAAYVYLISDDNFNPLQETLLLMFRLDG
ncbi:MAG: esterase-like activity of phytase family protein [Rhodospirillaceae bacterium]|nr:esterase-like activity of phytase family protein [Rhodospirillaceae bacterium]MBT4116703.1 esterase-like activity of phytase family protein [Rhodospirillaceae bacterium]MBT4674534.1 esterase-like activity of phytase family protein [Rhodospirillaceae bacterium]MBT4749440.1 esterase-like activity of phytase family protein [Rhodospirillaceae bacterium]MBT5178049.1 esterase-like activity of phytase family protein [Rhodospirillaceae bacterium]